MTHIAAFAAAYAARFHTATTGPGGAAGNRRKATFFSLNTPIGSVNERSSVAMRSIGWRNGRFYRNFSPLQALVVASSDNRYDSLARADTSTNSFAAWPQQVTSRPW